MKIINTIKSSGCPESDGGMHYEAHCADRLKLIYWDGSGIVMAYKRLEEHSFTWPGIKDGLMTLSHAQFEALFAGLDWRRVHAVQTRAPETIE
jgi:transposase